MFPPSPSASLMYMLPAMVGSALSNEKNPDPGNSTAAS
jgi:hypothetical protein